MKPFTYQRAKSPAEAATSAARLNGARFIAGGTNLLDLMKLQIETPAHLIDVNGLALDRIEPTAEGGLRIGALVRNTDLLSLFPEPLLALPECTGIVAVPARLPSLSTEISLVRRADVPLTPAAAYLAACLMQAGRTRFPD